MTALLDAPTSTELTDSPSSSTRASSNSGYVPVSIDRIISGGVLRNPIYDRKGVLLIKSGTTLTSSILEKLHTRDIVSILIHRDDMVQREASSRSGSSFSDPLKGDSGGVIEKTIRTQALALDPIKLDQAKHEVSESIDQARDLMQAMSKSATVYLDQPREVIESGFARIHDDPDVAVRAGLFPEKRSYPAGHGISSTTLAMAMGGTLGLDDRSIRELGIGCLLHDAGMLKVDREIVLSRERLGPEQARQVVQHVAATSQLMDNIRNVPPNCRIVAMQIHERPDGRGYPDHVSGTKFHPLSRIAAVADCFAAMISPRLYREAHSPYRTIEYMLREARTGRFDLTAMKALLSVVSVFPIGSLVELSDGRIGRVIRSNKFDIMRPVVEILLTSTSTRPVEIVDLKDCPEISVTRVTE